MLANEDGGADEEGEGDAGEGGEPLTPDTREDDDEGEEEGDEDDVEDEGGCVRRHSRPVAV